MQSVMKRWWVLSILQLSHGLGSHGLGSHGLVQDLEGPGYRRLEPSYISEIGQTQPSRAETHRLEADAVEEQLMIDAQTYDEASQELTEALQLQTRTMRSPRRCVPHQQSCLGHQLPCCDACDTCYCRFFNAICYCRRVGQACTHRRT